MPHQSTVGCLILERADIDAVLDNPGAVLGNDTVCIADFSSDNRSTAGYALEGNLDNIKDHEEERSRWRRLIDILVERGHFETLSFHSTALQKITYNRAPSNRSTEWIKRHHQLIKQEATQISVDDLVLSGQQNFEAFWPWLKIKKSIAIRGCQHAFRDQTWSRLANGRFKVPLLKLSIACDATVDTILMYMRNVAYVQRRRVLVGKKPFEQIHFLVRHLTSQTVQLLQHRWNTKPKEYDIGTLSILYDVITQDLKNETCYFKGLSRGHPWLSGLGMVSSGNQQQQQQYRKSPPSIRLEMDETCDGVDDLKRPVDGFGQLQVRCGCKASLVDTEALQRHYRFQEPGHWLARKGSGVSQEVSLIEEKAELLLERHLGLKEDTCKAERVWKYNTWGLARGNY